MRVYRPNAPVIQTPPSAIHYAGRFRLGTGRAGRGGPGAGKGTLAPYTTNLTFANTTNYRAQFRSGIGNTIIAFNGDSTMRGVDFSAVPTNSQYPNAMPVQLATLFNAASIAAGANNWFGVCGTNLADYTTRDSRIASTGGTAFGSNRYQGGVEARFPGVASTWSFTPPDNVDSFEIYWANQTATGRTQSYQIDGGATTNLATDGNNVQARATTTSSLGAHTVNMAWVSGGTTLLEAINCYNSTRTEISCWNMGISGGTSAQMVDNTGAPQQGRLQQLSQWPPVLIITEMGLVNDWRNSISVASSQANMVTFATFAKQTLVGCDLIFLTPPYDNGSAGLTANQNAYVTAMYAVAAQFNVPVIDIRQKWLSYANAVANGWQVAGDNIHPTKAGYIDQATVIYNALRAVM